MPLMPFDIVAYSYRADIYCPLCILSMCNEPSEFEEYRDVECALADYALILGIDRYDEYSYDSGDFPKVVFRDSVEDPEYCGHCHEAIDA